MVGEEKTTQAIAIRYENVAQRRSTGATKFVGVETENVVLHTECVKILSFGSGVEIPTLCVEHTTVRAYLFRT